jgi:DNA-binding response OmpR family regulator
MAERLRSRPTAGINMKHALIVEDREIIALMIQDELAELGYRSAVKATSQSQAIRFAKLRSPDIITADNQLSDGSGIEAVRHICRHHAIAVVFITGDRNAIAGSVPDAVILEKPFTHDELVRAVRAAEENARTYSYVHVL